ncbi:DUF2130 domain-containing protein [Synechocystis sp. FACHB-383]|uniref:DUF2130 domain-containing protein n=1 Tax=Synechocystis sp. FACHB-383 TaxID=2692864 RepID=UPI001689BB58|nr:DUF2130 domain-containing protein [Synechocystis sp. FACHB-383]MBD2655401.1 DUF2130 domain-containing protein [Synechocystis sp. FACHB-383]
MAKDQNTISCPECKAQININDILYHQIHEQVHKTYQDERRKEKDELLSKLEEIEKQKRELASEKERQEDFIANKLRDEKRKLITELTQKIQNKVTEEQKDAIDTLRAELDEKSSQIKELNRVTVQLEALKREKSELEEKYEAEAERKITERVSNAREEIKRKEEAKNELKLKELQKKLEDQKKLTEEMKRKQEQGSMQTQGEVQELAIEEWLAEKFPLDTIYEIKKGERGADCLQIVHTRIRQNCGSIYYESKRTKEFGSGWIEKFKQDIQERNANIGVLVTEVMPSDMDRLGLKDGVWICSFEEFKGLCTVLRESLIQISTAIVTQENKGDKMEMLYDYLTSNEFKLQIESIVEGFTQMKTDLEAEQRSMRTIWKKREKQIEKVLMNTTAMYGSIRGIAGSAIGAISALELPDEKSEILLEDHS